MIKLIKAKLLKFISCILEYNNVYILVITSVIILLCWTERFIQQLNRKEAEITFDPHLFHRVDYRHLNFDFIEETIRDGDIYPLKCELPNKICFKRYFGKCNQTYTVIVRYNKEFIEVKTAWNNNGR